MNREVLLEKLEACFSNNDTKLFIDLIFDFSDEDIVSLTEEELNRIFSISKQINMKNVNEFFEYLESEGGYCLNNAMNGVNELNNALLGKYYFEIYVNLLKKSDEKRASAMLHKGVACFLLSNFGVNTQANLEISIDLYKSAQKIFSKDSTGYAIVLMNEASARLKLAERGVETQWNLTKAVKLYKSAQKIFPKDSTDYALTLMNEATAQLKLAEKGVDTQNNLTNAVKLYKSAQKMFPKGSTDYARTLMNEASARLRLSEIGVETQENLTNAFELYKSVQKMFHKDSTSYALALMNEASARLRLSEIGVEMQENLKNTVKLYKSAQKIFHKDSTDYASALTNEANVRQRLAERDVEPQENLTNAVKLYKSAQKIFPKDSTDYALTLMNEASARQKLAERGVEVQENLTNAVKLNIRSISILEKLNDGGIYSSVLLNLNRLFIDNFRKTGDWKYLKEANKILGDAENKIKNRDVWYKELIQANLHEIKATLLEFEGKSGIEKAAREYNEAYKLTGSSYYNFMDEFSRARTDIEAGAFCKLVNKWKDTEKYGIFLDYFDYSIYEYHLEKAGESSGIKLENEFKLAQKKLEEIRDRTQIKIIKDRVSAYVFLMNALVASFRKESYDDAKKNIREACRIFDKYGDKGGSKTCELFSDAVIKNKDPQSWRAILRNKDRLSCNIYRLLSEGADRKREETGFGKLTESTERIESKIDDISIKIDEFKTELHSGFGRIKEKVEQGFEDKSEQSQDIINRLENTQLKLEKLAEISKRSKGKEGDSIRQFSKQILLLLENEDSEALERFVKEVINNEESLITEINDSTMPDKEKTKAKGFLKKFKKIPKKAKKEAGAFGKNVSYNLATALMAEEIIKHIFPLISTAIIGVPIPSHLLELLSKAIPKK